MACFKSIRSLFRRCCLRLRQGHRVHPSTDGVIRQDPDQIQNDTIERECQQMKREGKARRKFWLMKKRGKGKAVKAGDFKPEIDAEIRAKSDEMMGISDEDLGNGEDSDFGHSTEDKIVDSGHSVQEDKIVDLGHSVQEDKIVDLGPSVQEDKIVDLGHSVQEDKIVDLGHSTEDKIGDFHNHLDDYEATKTALHEAQIRIRTLEQELLVKTQAVSEVESLLNDSMVMATAEIEKIRRQLGTRVNAKYKKAERDLKVLQSEFDQLDSTNVKLEKLVLKLEDEVKEYRAFLPFERRGSLDDISENPRINYDRLLQLGTLWKSRPSIRLTPDLGLEETEPMENLESETSQVPSGHKEPECFMDIQDPPVPRTVKDTKKTLDSDLTEQVGPKPP